MTEHNIPPVYDADSRILVLGSFPSVKSREERFFYAHKQNRFWRMLSAVLEKPTPESVEEKRNLLLSGGIALWDVIASCDIVGSSDSSIKNVRVNDVNAIVKRSRISRIILNGRTAERYYDRYLRDTVNAEAVCMPSTSAANASAGLDTLISVWREALTNL